MDKVPIKPFSNFAKEWALITAGTKEKFNSMTVAWGAMGTLWNKPVIQIFIRPCRYTFQFLEHGVTYEEAAKTYVCKK